MISNCKFKNNLVLERGAAVYIKDCYYEIKNSLFEDNKAVGNYNDKNPVDSLRGEGGGVYA